MNAIATVTKAEIVTLVMGVFANKAGSIGVTAATASLYVSTAKTMDLRGTTSHPDYINGLIAELLMEGKLILDESIKTFHPSYKINHAYANRNNAAAGNANREDEMAEMRRRISDLEQQVRVLMQLAGR